MYSFLKSRKNIFYILTAISISSLAIVLFLFNGSSNEVHYNTSLNEGYNTINPQYIEGSSSLVLIGKYVSNEVANIYPRRNGVIKDILVDIGDEVIEGQSLATLLPIGVEDQSKYQIEEKLAKYKNAKALFNNEIHVSENKKIDLERKLENKIELEASVLKNALDNINQQKEQAETATYNLRQVVENILVEDTRLSRDHLTDSDVNYNLGAMDSVSLKRAVDQMNNFVRLEEKYQVNPENINNLITEIIQLANTLQIVLNNTITGARLTDEQLDMMQHKLHTAQDKIYKARERLEDAINNHNIVASKYETEIDSLKTQLEIIKANNTKNIELRKNELSIAQSSLNKENSVSGNTDIKSPFSGTISGRFIEIGEMSNSHSPAFTLTNVQTSLSRAAKNEIKFEVPQEYIEIIETGDKIEFFINENDDSTHIATIFRKSELINSDTHTVTVQAKDDAPAQTFAHNTSVRIRLSNIDNKVFKIPSIHAKRENDQNYIWVLSNSGSAEKMNIQLISEDGEFAEISGEIDEKTMLITNPPL